MVGRFVEPVSIVAESMSLQHPQHLRTGTLHNSDARQECRPDAKRKNWMLGRGRERALSCDDVVEVWDKRAKNPVAPEFGVAREWPRHPAHQQEAGNFQR